MFRAKSYFLVKEQSYRHPADNLEYPKDLVLELEYKDDLVNRAFSAPLLTNYSSKSCSKDRNRATIL